MSEPASFPVPQPPPNLSGVDSDPLLIAQWLQRRPSAHTREAYARDVAAFLEHAGRPRLREVTLRHLTDWEAVLLDRGLAVATVNRKLAAVRSLLSHGQRTGYLHFNVGAAVQPRPLPDRTAERILSEHDILNLLASPSPQRQGERNRVLLALLYYTGARISEVLALRWRDLRLDPDPGGQAVAILHGKGGKTRHVALAGTCVEGLRALRPDPHDPDAHVFVTRNGGPMSRHGAAQVVRAAARRAGITAKVSPHWLRHAHATHALLRGAPAHVVQGTLGHASLATTIRYAHMAQGESSGLVLAGAAG
ncbi:MAG: tyrosine-type recombinase/integrase [Caldilineaceae bacterium]|nr:tyrosine-type recombinase/integrase [Caldilineaceae bacterium]